MSSPRRFDEIARDWVKNTGGRITEWEPFTRFTFLVCLAPVLPVACVGALLALIQLVLVARGEMRTSQRAPLIGALAVSISVTCLSLFVLYPAGQRAFEAMVGWVSAHAPGPFANIATLLRWYQRLFFPPLGGPTPV